MAQQFMDNMIWEKDYGPFRVFVYINDEDIDPKDCISSRQQSN